MGVTQGRVAQDLYKTAEDEERPMPDEEKSFEKYLDSRLSNIETVIEHQTKQLAILCRYCGRDLPVIEV